MLRVALKKSWRQLPRKQHLYGHSPPITKFIEIRRTGHAEHCWRSKDELISEIHLCTPVHGRAKFGRPTRTYIKRLCRYRMLPGRSPDRMIKTGGERGSARSVQVVRYDEDDDAKAKKNNMPVRLLYFV